MKPEKVLEALRGFYPGAHEGTGEGHTIEVVWTGHDGFLTVPEPRMQLAVGTLQTFLDDYLRTHGGEVDYIHGDDVARELGSRPGNMGFLLPAMGKEQLFKTVMADGVLPRKTFSMGHAQDKRYYVEARKIGKLQNRGRQRRRSFPAALIISGQKRAPRACPRRGRKGTSEHTPPSPEFLNGLIREIEHSDGQDRDERQEQHGIQHRAPAQIQDVEHTMLLSGAVWAACPTLLTASSFLCINCTITNLKMEAFFCIFANSSRAESRFSSRSGYAILKAENSFCGRAVMRTMTAEAPAKINLTWTSWAAGQTAITTCGW